MLLFAVAAVMMMLSACTNDNTCVKQIVEVINQGAEQYKALENGSIDLNDLQDGELFTMPNGNIFANEQIYAIIEKNADYKLTDTDKTLLTDAVKQFASEKDNLEAMATNAASQHAIGTIISAKKLKDLYAHGSTL